MAELHPAVINALSSTTAGSIVRNDAVVLGSISGSLFWHLMDAVDAVDAVDVVDTVGGESQCRYPRPRAPGRRPQAPSPKPNASMVAASCPAMICRVRRKVKEKSTGGMTVRARPLPQSRGG